MPISNGTKGNGARSSAKSQYFKAVILAMMLLAADLLLVSDTDKSVEVGLITVVVICFGFKIAADFIDRRAPRQKEQSVATDMWIEAEDNAAIKLEQFPEASDAFNDITFNGLTIEHVAVDPGGNILVETPSHRGKVDANGEDLLPNAKPPVDDLSNPHRGPDQEPDPPPTLPSGGPPLVNGLKRAAG